MRALAQVVLAAAKLHDDLLVTLAVLLDRGRDLGALDERRADVGLVTVADEQDFAEFDRRAGFAREGFNLEDGAFLDPILFAARGDDRVHRDNSAKFFRNQRLKRCAIPKGRAFYGTPKGRSKPKYPTRIKALKELQGPLLPSPAPAGPSGGLAPPHPGRHSRLRPPR